MEFLKSFLRRYFAGKPVVASRNVGCFLRLAFLLLPFALFVARILPCNQSDSIDFIFLTLQCNEEILLENARLRGELQVAQRNESSLREQLASLKQTTVTFIMDQMDALQMHKDTQV